MKSQFGIKVGNLVLLLVAFTATTTVFTGCEQINQLADKESQELKDNTERQQAELAPLVGRYEGTLTDPTRSPESATSQVQLVLVPNTIIVQNPGRNDISLYPTLGGTLSVIDKGGNTGSDKTGALPGDQDSVIPIAHYSMIKFDPSSGALQLNGTYASNSAGTIMVYLEGVYQFGRISGKASSSLVGDLGTLELHHVTR